MNIQSAAVKFAIECCGVKMLYCLAAVGCIGLQNTAYHVQGNIEVNTDVTVNVFIFFLTFQPRMEAK